MLQVQWLGTWLEKLPHPGKHKLEGVDEGQLISRGARPSKTRSIGSNFLHETDKWHNPDPLYQLIGEANESKIIIENKEHKALIDSGAKVSLEKLGLKIQNLQTLLGLEGAHGGEVPYLGYTELQLQIPGVPGFMQDVLMLVVPDMNYNSMVPVTIGTLHIDMILESATKEELDKLSKQWKCGVVNQKVVSQQMKINNDIIKHVEGEVKLGKNVTIGPLETLKTKGITKLPYNEKRINVSIGELEDRDQMIKAIPSYDYLEQGSIKVNIALQNCTRQRIKLKKGTKVALIMSANVVPPALAPKTDEKDSKNMESLNQRLTKLLNKLDLSNISDWTKNNQESARDLIAEYQHLFALNDLELGKTSLVKHKIKLSDL